MKTESTKRKSVRDLIVELPLMAFMSACMVYPFVTALGLGQGIFFVVLFSLLFASLWTVAFYNNRNLMIAVVLISVSACAFSLLYLAHNGGGAYSAFHYQVSDFLYWAGNYLKGYRTTNEPFSNCLVLLFEAFVCMAVGLFTVKRFSVSAVVLSGAACFASLFIIGHKIDTPSLFGYILASTLYFLLHSYKRNSKEQAPGRALKLPAFIASGLPLAALVLALTILLSQVVEIDPAWMKDTRDKLIKKSQPVSDGVSRSTGTLVVSGDELGGDLYLNDDVVMVVASPVGNAYLRALSKDEYTGHSWKQTDTNASTFDTASHALFDTQETTEAMPALAQDEGMFDRLFPAYEMTVDYTGRDPGVIYAPLKMSSLDVPGGVILVGSDELMLSMSADNGLSYSLRFYQPQYGTEEFAELARKSTGRFYQGLQAAGGGDAGIAGRYADIGGKRENYLQLPQELPAEVRDLAREVTRTETNDYDKAKAIEQYLSSHYAYTLTPGSVDKSVDFVYNFLFVNKKGYCTYYASAMAVMLRCVGIPSRYVEGYVLPEKNPSTGLFSVTKRQGHAWVEAYFQGLGWIQFEPTASFSNTVQPADNIEPTGTPALTTAPPAPSAGAGTDEPSTEASAGGTPINLLPLIPFAAVILLLALLLLAHRANVNTRRMQPADAALLLFGQYVRLLALQGVSMEAGETSAVYAARVDKLYGFTGSAFGKAAEVFQIARYSGHEVSEEQKGLMLAFRKTLLAASRRKLGWLRHLFFKLLWSI